MANPETREEHYLNAMLGNEACPHYPEATRSRVENYLDALCHKSSGGSAIVSDHAPTAETAGTVGQLWEDSSTGELYILESIDTTDPDDPVYIWVVTGGGTMDYTNLSNKPKINSVTLEGDLTNRALNLASLNGNTFTDPQTIVSAAYAGVDLCDADSQNIHTNLGKTGIFYANGDEQITIDYADIATKTYVDTQVGDIETILTAINTGTGV